MTFHNSHFRPFVARFNHLVAMICVVFAFLLGGVATAAPGQLDATFGVAGQVVPINYGGVTNARGSAVINSDNSVVVADNCYDGTNTKMCAKKLTSTGATDLGFGIGGIAVATFQVNASPSLIPQIAGKVALVRQPDGKLLASAHCFHVNVPTSLSCVARFMPNGSLDASFNGAGDRPGTLVSMGYLNGFGMNAVVTALQSDGKILVAGSCGSPEAMCVIRLTSAGLIDVTFAGAATSMARALPFGTRVTARA